MAAGGASLGTAPRGRVTSSFKRQNIMKTLRIIPTIPVVLSLILATLFVATPVWARKVAGVATTATIKLARPADAPEPRAFGQYTMYRDSFNCIEEGTVSCRNLTPGRQYVVVVLVHWSSWARIGYEPYPTGSGSYFMEIPATADTRGRLNAQFTVVGSWSYSGGINRTVRDLWIENNEGIVVLE